MVFEQYKHLLQDEIDYANVLRGQRTTIASLLALVIGLGLFKFSLFSSRNDIVPVAGWPLLLMSFIFTAAAIFIVWGTWNLYTEKSRKDKKDVANTGKSISLGGDHEDESPELVSELEHGKSSASLAVLNLSRRHRKILESAPPILVIRAKSRIYKIAYKRLSKANRRVRYRIERGRQLIFVGLGLVFAAFLLYVWVIAVRWNSIDAAIDRSRDVRAAQDANNGNPDPRATPEGP